MKNEPDFDEAFGDPPLMWTRDGESRMPKEVWTSACRIVAFFEKMQDNPETEDAAIDTLRTLIATAMLTERRQMN